MSDFHDRDKWEKYLADFSQRNKSRPARLERFEEGEVAEEEQLTLLESITVQRDGPNARHHAPRSNRSRSAHADG